MHQIRYGLLVMALLLLSSGLAQTTRLILATTTSTYQSGLLDVLLPPFEAHFGFDVDVIAVGTGAALELGRGGDADVLLAHAPAAEMALVEAGYAVERTYLMYNDFVLVGPVADPAGIAGAASAAEALARIAQVGATFISRGDNSGTHIKELELWTAAGITPGWGRYLEIGQGMRQALFVADEQRAYTLTDRGTYLAVRDRLELTILFEGDPLLFNPYHVMAVNPQVHPHVNHAGAMALIAWLSSPEAKSLIDGFTASGEPLFFTTPLD
ncbi:MAG: substrate-binding domain-containing protein [Truepera sp.]|nr:substrate-binding domain-containing protein [Truepera sp.]